MTVQSTDMQALVTALDAFTQSTQAMEEAYRRLEARVSVLDRELAGKNRELAMTTDYLSNLLESISDGCIAIDMEGVITRFNRAATVILGYSAAELTGRPFNEVFGREFGAPRRPGSGELESKSGRSVPVSERDSLIAGHDGRLLGSVKTFEDLSELIALRAQVRQIDRLAAIGEMAATIAHEIRNPLGGIRGFAAFLAEDIGDGDPRKRLVLKIQEGVQSLDRVVNELLEYTRPVEIEMRPACCKEMIEAALAYLDTDGKSIHITCGAEAGINALADKQKTGQVLLNILLNAVQSIDGAGEIRIEVSADGAEVSIAITDTGCGMDEEEAKQVFSPFYTTKEKGTGLGLAVSHKIIEAHGGGIGVRSAPGAGSTFTVRLPQAE